MFIMIIADQVESSKGYAPKMKTSVISKRSKKSTITQCLVLLVFLMGVVSVLFSAAVCVSEVESYVHNFVGVPPYGNWTFVEKPVFPVHFNQSQIPVGSNWTVVSPLTANHSYHVYFYGDWIDRSPRPSTDYDIYVYDPLAQLEGYHTESAGLPEHLGRAVDEPYFTPRYSGNYSFVLRNDPRESNASEAATFMLVENIETDKWQEVFTQGKENDEAVYSTSWAFEFVADSPRIEVLVRVPDTLDMYEARLYLMANPKAGTGETLNNVPLAWEQGLFGEIKQAYGGYNIESSGYRGVAYASCESYGQDMLINYTTQLKDKSLYHLVFIGEKGAGKLDFLVKTQFGKARILPVNAPSRAYPDAPVNMSFSSDATDLKNATMDYSVTNWANSTSLSVQLNDNRTCSVNIPGQPAGTTVRYRIEAVDVLENSLTYNGSYVVKYLSQLNLTLKSDAISIGENLTLSGLVTPPGENLTISLVFKSTNTTKQQLVRTGPEGTFVASYRPPTEGKWMVQATFDGSNLLFESTSQMLEFSVNPPSFMSQYSIYIYVGGGVGTVAAIAAVVVIRRRRD
jgi:hypothetical protein